MNEDQARRSVRLSEEAGACQPPGILSRISASDGGRGGIRSTISAAAKNKPRRLSVGGKGA